MLSRQNKGIQPTRGQRCAGLTGGEHRGSGDGRRGARLIPQPFGGRYRVFAAACFLAGVACQHQKTGAKPDLAASTATSLPLWGEGSPDAACVPIAGASALLRPGARIQIGEMHGNIESPRAIGELACLALAQNASVRVALELPAAEESAIAKFLNSGGSPADRAALTAGAFWTGRSQDGRSSRAMAELIDRVRLLRRGGRDIRIITFDATDADRDRAMADRLAASLAAEPSATFIILSGNLHARKTIGQVPFRPKSAFMAEYIAQRGVPLATLDVRYSRGSSWACTFECGPIPIGRGQAKPLGIELRSSPDGAYDGILNVGTPHFSPPAAVPMTAAQEELARLLPLRSEGIAAYEAKQYGHCAKLFAELAAGHRKSEDAYNAACCWALAADVNRAFAALETAVDLGLKEKISLETDPDLAALRTDPRWPALLARVHK